MIEGLRTIRKTQRKTLKNVSDATGLSISFLSDMERGRTEPSMATLRKLAACYGGCIVVMVQPEAEEGEA